MEGSSYIQPTQLSSGQVQDCQTNTVGALSTDKGFKQSDSGDFVGYQDLFSDDIT